MGKERNCNFPLQHEENVHQIDVPITRETSKGKVLYKSSVKYPFLKRGIIVSRTQVSNT